jgi:phosphoenolpyruvate-protein kinase (PTS system EI component)
MGWYATQHAGLAAQCASAPVSPDDMQAELERSRLALAQESTARAAVQKAADASAAEVGLLRTELLFLRDQSQKRR